MVLTELNTSYAVQFDYNPRIIQALKKIPKEHRRFDPASKKWLVSKDSSDTLMLIAKRFRATFTQSQQPEHIGELRTLPEPSESVVGFCKQNMKLQPYHYQLQGIEMGMEMKRFINGDEPGLGKSQLLSSVIKTPYGDVKMGDIKIGDKIFSRNGAIQEVTGVFPQGKVETYKVTFNDGSKTYCNLEHLWAVRDENRRRKNTGFVVKTLKEIVRMGIHLKSSKGRTESGRQPVPKWEIPMCDPVQFPHKDLFIDHYLMGVLIGDGALTSSSISLSLPESKHGIIEYSKKLLDSEYQFKKASGEGDIRFFITNINRRNNNEYCQYVSAFGLNVLSPVKFIPKLYMQGSIQQRKMLLAGLMDTDGSCIKNRTTFHTTSERLAHDVKELVESLGGIVIIRPYDRSHEQKSLEFQVNIRTSFNPFFAVQYKANAWKPNKRFLVTRYITSVDYVGEFEQQCISVSSPDKLYLTDNYIVTHNTMQSIGTVTALNAFPCLVICPSTLKENWRREWSEKFTNKRAVVMNDSIKHTWDTFLKVGMVDVFIVNYESLKKYFVKEIKPHPGRKMRLNDIVFKESITLFKSIVLDELHKCKDGSTQQSKYCMGIARDIDIRIGLTGTPIVNKPKDMIAQLHIIGRLMDFGGYKHFVNRYCDGGSGANNLGELHWRLHDLCFFRRNKKDVLKDLPDRVRQVMVCDISTRTEYNNAKNDFVKYLYDVKKCTDEEVAKKLRAMFMVQLGQLKAISAKGKLESVFDWVDEIVESGEKVILFCSLREIGDRVMERYGSICVAVRGDVTGDARQKAVDSFQKCGQCGVLHQDHKGADHDFVNNEIKVIVCSIKAAGVGLTLTASSRIGFIEFPWTDADCDQCESRAHRNGQEMSVECKYFLGDKTVDSYCYDIIKEKRSIAKMVAGQEDIQEDVIDNLINIFKQ